MNRKAILIESSRVCNLDDLPGARKDIENWINFLQSNLGGAWNKSEIFEFHTPRSSQVETELRVNADCYSFVVFSGHGSDGSIVLNDILDDYPIDDLIPTSHKKTVIIDSCRGPKQINAFSASTSIFANRLIKESEAGVSLMPFLRKIDKHLHQEQWYSALKKSSIGTVMMLSCSKGQSADEDPSAGGYYTSLLLQGANNWKQCTSGSAVYWTDDAHSYAVKKLPPQQKPEYLPTHTNLSFPFAVTV